MKAYSLPEGWEQFSTELLAAKATEIRTLAAKIDETVLDAPAPEEGEGVSGIEYAESLASAKKAVDELIDTQATEAAAVAERRAAVLSDLTDPEPDPEPEVTPEPEVVEPVAEEVEPVAETIVEETVVVEETVEIDVEVPDTPAELIDDPTPAPVEPEVTPEPVGAMATKDAGSGLRAMNARRTASEQPRPASTSPSGRLRAVGEMTTQGWVPGQFMEDPDQLTEFVTGRLRNIGSSNYEGPREQVNLLSSHAEFASEYTLSATDVQHNFGVFELAKTDYQAEQEALVAAGSPCAPLMPSYDFQTWYGPQRPIEQGLVTVNADRGGIKYLDQSRITTEAAAGITVKDATAAALEPGDGGYAQKNCTRISCPTETEVTVGLVQWCVRFDNLRYKVFPEFVRKVLGDLAVEYAKAKEVFYLDRMDTLAGSAVDIAAALAGLTATNTFGAGRSLYADLTTAAANYRKRNNMGRDAILDVWLPTIVEDILAVDTANDPNMSTVGTIVSGPNGNLTQVLAQRARLNVNWYYYDSTNVGFPASEFSDAAGTWNPLPTVFRSYMHAPGAVVRLDAGELNLGVYRDSALNKDNDLEMFAEQWLEVANPTAEIVSFDHTTCYSGVGPLHAAAAACP